MARRLSESDASAVDVVLNDARGGSGFAEPVGDAVIKAVAAVDGMLRLLDQLPTENPPAGLVARTMALIQRQGEKVNAVLQSQQLNLGQSQRPA